MITQSQSASNRKKYILGAIFVGWLALSFYLTYYFITTGVFGWRLFSDALLKYLIYFYSVSIIILIYSLTSGKILEFKKHARIFIVISSILLVFAFSFIRWNTLVTMYGQNVSGSQAEMIFSLKEGEGTAFEREMAIRQGIANKYDIAFRQVWTFGGFIFASIFLILMALGKKENDNKQRIEL